MKNLNTIQFFVISVVLFLFQPADCHSKIWLVGPTRTYKAPSAVVNLVANGDSIYIDAGKYSGDVAAWSKNNLFFRGIGGMAHLDANGNSSQGKAIWVISGSNNRMEYIEFSGCTVIDQNGAGIRLQAPGLTIRHCYFHDNDDGILGGTTGKVFIEKSEFYNNGFGDGYSHNIYISNIDTFILQFCYMHHAKVGHEIKSRAHVNFILYNRVMTEADGTGSREMDIPNGGRAFIIGNLIEKGPQTGNSNFIEFGLEGLTNPAPHNLYVINNTFVNDRGGPGLLFSLKAGTKTFKAYNNLFAGTQYTFLSGADSTLDTLSNLYISDKTKAGFIDLANYDYTIGSSSPAINKGSNSGSVSSFSLTPAFQYLQPDSFIVRTSSGAIDIGAYEYMPLTQISPVSSEKNVLIYQIPGYPVLTIAFPGIPANIGLHIFDISGKSIGSLKAEHINQLQWNTSWQLRGIYILECAWDGRIMTKKIILN